MCPSRQNNPIKCGYCGKIGHHEEECRKKKSESASTSWKLTNYVANSEYDDYGGLFVIRHRANSMSTSGLINTSKSKDVWFVDSSTSNHMTSHQEWFWDLWELDRPGYVKTGDDTTHPIRHVENISIGKNGEQTCTKNGLHVPTITKNLISVGQIVEQGMQVRFNQGGCFIEKEGRLTARDWREDQMFIIESNEVKSAMFAKGR